MKKTSCFSVKVGEMVVEVVYPDVGSIFTDAELCARSSEAPGKLKPSTGCQVASER